MKHVDNLTLEQKQQLLGDFAAQLTSDRQFAAKYELLGDTESVIRKEADIATNLAAIHKISCSIVVSLDAISLTHKPVITYDGKA